VKWIELPLADTDRERTWRHLESVRDRLPFTGHALSPIAGGRSEGLSRLARFDARRYAGSRGRTGVDRGASGLSPWVRHGLLTLPEVRRAATAKAGPGGPPVKFLQELAWREYFLGVRRHLGDPALWQDIEAPKVALGDASLPDDVRFGRTGLACIDENIEELRTMGTMVNQARMWVASYVVHHRRVRWQEGAAWFLQHLLDGDPASNNLSWQWVASTFSHKPYLFERGGVERQGDHCARCPKARRGCPFSSPKEDRLHEFGASGSMPQATGAPWESRGRANRPNRRFKDDGEGDSPGAPDLLWIHGDHLAAPANPLLEQHPDVPAVFVFDTTLPRSFRISGKRMGFLYEGISETLKAHPGGGRVLVGDPIDVLPELAGTGPVATTATLGDRFAAIAGAVRSSGATLREASAPTLVPQSHSPVPPRFSRWWTKVESTVLGGQSGLGL